MIRASYLKNKIKNEDAITHKNYGFKTTNGGGILKGMVILRTKIFNIEKLARFFIIEDGKFAYDVLIGLDLSLIHI